MHSFDSKRTCSLRPGRRCFSAPILLGFCAARFRAGVAEYRVDPVWRRIAEQWIIRANMAGWLWIGEITYWCCRVRLHYGWSELGGCAETSVRALVVAAFGCSAVLSLTKRGDCCARWVGPGRGFLGVPPARQAFLWTSGYVLDRMERGDRPGRF